MFLSVSPVRYLEFTWVYVLGNLCTMFLLRNLFVSQPKSIYTSQHIVRQLSHITRLNEQLNGTYTPRRACLYVPGNDEKKLKKIETLDSDCVILDCEDGVAINKKVCSCHKLLSRITHVRK